MYTECCSVFFIWQHSVIIQFSMILLSLNEAYGEREEMIQINSCVTMQHTLAEQVETTFENSTNITSSESVFILVQSSYATRFWKENGQMSTKNTIVEEWSVSVVLQGNFIQWKGRNDSIRIHLNQHHVTPAT